MHNNDAVAALQTLLGKEADLLRSGRIDDLEPIAAEKARLIGVIQKARTLPHGADLTALKRMTTRNAALMEGCRNGLLAARQRLVQMREGTPLRTYGRDGNMTQISGAPGAVSHRA